MKNRPLFLAALTAFALSTASAQTTAAQLTGVVQDPQSASVPAAGVTITNVDTGMIRKATSNELGYYSFALLQPGTYQLEVRKEGFRPLTRSGLVLSVGQVARVDLTLELGAVTEAVNVTAGVALVETSRPESGVVITTRQFDQMPLLQQGRMRNPASFIYLTPRVQGNVNPNGTDYVGATNEIHTGGGRGSETEVTVDGIVAGRTQLSGSFTEVAPPVDAVREFRVTSSLMSAEQGHSGVGQVAFQLKSGTNQFHGSVYEYLRNDKLDARSWMSANRTTTRQNEFGFSAGGPVRIPKLYNGTDRTFFFVAYAGSRKRGATSNMAILVPTPANIRGDFSDIRDNRGNLRAIYDPATTQSDGRGGFTRDPFPENRIPTGRIDPVAAKIASYIPAPNSVGGLNYMGLIGERMLDPDAWVFKGDHSFTANQKITVSLNTTDIPRLRIDSPLPDPLAPGLDQVIKGYTGRISYDYIIRPDLLHQLSLGYNLFDHTALNLTANVVPGDWPSLIGLTGVTGQSFPVMNFTEGYASYSTTGGTYDDEQVYSLRDSLSWFKGKHSLKLGIEYRSPRPNIRSTSNDNGTFNFNSLGTALPSQNATTGNGFASFLLGDVQSATLSYPSARWPRRPYWGFFVQDDLKLTRRLTLNLGFRYEFTLATTDAVDAASTVSLTEPNPGAGGIRGAMIFAGNGPGRTGRPSFVDTDYSSIGPRIGFAFQSDPKTVIRAGYGLYYSNNYLDYSNSGFGVSASFTSLDNGLTPAFRLRDGYPQNFRQTAAIDPTFLNGRDVSIVEQSSAAMPRTQNWTLSLQRELSTNLVVEATYIGTRGTRQTAVQLETLNQVDPKYLALGPLLTQNIRSQAAIDAGIRIPYPEFSGTVAQALRPYPQFLGVSSTAAKAGNSKYNGATFSIRKRTSSGFTTDAHYTYSKAMGYTEYSAPSNGTDVLGMDNYNRQIEFSLLPYDMKHSFLATYSYTLPFGRGGSLLADGWVGKLLEDWTVSGVHRYQSGFPLRVTMTNTLPIFNRIQRPDVLASTSPTTELTNGDFNPYVDRRINLSAFGTPAPYRFGTAPPAMRNLRTFGIAGEDFSVTKATRISERFSFENYCQIFNALNRHRFAQFDTNFSSSNFGRAQSVSLPRYIQLGLRFRF